VARDASANLFQTMITIRSSKNSSEVRLSCLEATLTTPRSVYSISSDDRMIEPGIIFWWRAFRCYLLAGLALSSRGRTGARTANVFAP
jgi:hypothetical protein